MRTDKLMPMLLQLFDGEGGAADGTGSAPATQNNTADNTAPATQDGAHESTAEDLDKEFKALIKDKYKNAYQKHINAAMQKRFRADEAAQAQYDRVLPLLDMLAKSTAQTLRTRRHSCRPWKTTTAFTSRSQLRRVCQSSH